MQLQPQPVGDRQAIRLLVFQLLKKTDTPQYPAACPSRRGSEPAM